MVPELKLHGKNKPAVLRSDGDSKVIVITKFKLTKGYEVWKKAFDSNEAMRLQRGVRVLAVGHENGNENNVYTVVEMNSVEDKRLEDPVMIKSREEAGVDHASLEIIPLVE